MKVFYIGKFLNYWNTENYVAYALQQNNIEVVKRFFTCTGTLFSYTEQIEKANPDFVLFSKVESGCFPKLISWCKEHHILTVCWLWDLYWGYRKQRPAQFLCDMLFTTDGGHAEEWVDHGSNHFVLRQGIHEPDHVLYPIEPIHDLAFVGSQGSTKERKSLTNWLRSRYGTSIKWYSTTRGLDLNRVLASTKIVVGASHPLPNYWSNRVYEILGRGGFLLFPETVGLEEEFTDGVHYVSYKRNNFGALEQTISHYLQDHAKREQIRLQGFDKSLEYTYTTRVAKLLQSIGQPSKP